MKGSEVRESAFFGRITAGMTHEMKNVLAIIRESTGLLEDLLYLQKDDSFPHKEKFVKTLSTIQGQVRRGVELSNRLNRFAHSPDEAVGNVDLNETAEQLAFLCQRFARLRNVTLEAHPFEKAVSVTTSYVRLQMALFLCLECCWNHMKAGEQLHLLVEKKDNRSLIRILPKGGPTEQESLLDILTSCPSRTAFTEIIGELGGNVEKDDSSSGLKVSFAADESP